MLRYTELRRFKNAIDRYKKSLYLPPERWQNEIEYLINQICKHS